MKKNEFFAQLRTAFAGMDEELIMDILGDYENHFKEGMENGKSEEEICEELGNVEEIRQAFLDENPAAMTINVNSNSDAVGNSDIYNRFYPGIQRVNAQLTDADIEIKKSSTNDVELSVTGGLADDMEALKETLRVSASVGTLLIQQEKKAGISVSYAASRLFGIKVGKYSARIVIHIAVPEQFEKEVAMIKKKGVFDVVSGVLVGKPQDEEYYEEYKDILVKVVNDPDLPIIYNVNFGHATPRCVLQYGAMARVDMKQKKIKCEVT